MITKLELKNFTVFHNLSIDFSPKINVIIGENGTGKTHLLKAAYALYKGSEIWKPFPLVPQEDGRAAKFKTDMLRLFMPLNDELGDLQRRNATENATLRAFFHTPQRVEIEFNSSSELKPISHFDYDLVQGKSVFLPAKEVLSFMEGFTSLYEQREVSFEKTYYDICLLLDLPKFRYEALHPKAKWAIEQIEAICEGHFVFKGGGNVSFKRKISIETDTAEFSANTMAEGFRKIGVLSRLLETGAIQPGAGGPLFWDEPESNLNPKLLELLVKILLELSRNGQQIILATHDYVLLKWFDLLMEKDKGDQVRFHTLYRDYETGETKIASTDDYLAIEQNAIADTYSKLYDATINRSFGDKTK